MGIDHRFNTPTQMAARLLYSIHLVVALAGISTVLRGLFFHEGAKAWFFAWFALATALLCRLVLKRNRQLDECEHSLAAMFSLKDDVFGGIPAGAEFEALLRRRDQMERCRGTPDFDPWAILDLQRQIRDFVRENPELEPFKDLHDNGPK